MQINEYLNRIGIDKEVLDKTGTYLNLLTELQNKHLLSIPFEDLDIPFRRIELDLNKIYNKIIPTKRGGFCYELNGLFHWLLTSLGFKADMLSARVFNNQTKEFGPEFDHMTLLVHLENGDYLTDVGFGDSFRIPLKMSGGEVEDVSGRYRVYNIEKDIYEVQKQNENAWEPQYRFSITPRKFSDFEEMCSLQQDSPTSHFRTRMLCTIATEKGRITLSNNSLTVTEGKSKNKISFESRDEFDAYSKKYFGIEV